MESKHNLSAYQTRLTELSMSPRTVSFYTADYALFLRYCSGNKQQLSEMTNQVLRNFFLWHEQDNASRSVLRRCYTALKKAYDLNFLPETLSFFKKPLDDLPVLRAVLKEIKKIPDKRLTQIVLAQLYVAGCDMSHLRSLRRSNVDLNAQCITVHGKTSAITKECSALLARHLTQAYRNPDYLFITKLNNQLTLLSPQAIWRLIRGLYPKSPEAIAQLKQIIEKQMEHQLLDSSLRDVYHNTHPRD